MIASLSGIRGKFGADLGPEDVPGLTGSFGRAVGSHEFLVGRDTRTTGNAMARAAIAGLLALGGTVYDYGVVSTPALFRESRLRNLPAVMVTASHNEPEFNGLKFIVGGAGAGKELFDSIVSRSKQEPGELPGGAVRRVPRTSYADDLVDRFGAGSGEGVSVAADFGGGAAISHAVSILSRLGCQVTTLNDAPGVFSRRVDPVADDLALLKRTVREKRCDIGLGFDCDGDRLVIVDSEGKKRTGDQMLTLALSDLLRERGEKKVVVSMDTTRAVDDVAEGLGCRAYRSKVGEANVVAMMNEVGTSLGGEGSSGGLIDASFNSCRDSMLAALAIIRALKKQGRKFYESVPSYHIARTAVQVPRSKVRKAMKSLAREHPGGDATDGLKVALPKRSWVLVRPSGTEDVVRVSAESTTAQKAEALAASFANRLKGLSR